ncbi:PREDICTED: uncharacterized protein LOC107070577 [Polistes dominula]|uniref:Uncharacterized protein LOC107070577 n=1 Tax=Polistes dominula TaxID=743375 RepID=A0ABM1IW07_POLDO|nr:PREDICTED: uncharacterized protein LOC107070577 [Polistes dominula]
MSNVKNHSKKGRGKHSQKKIEPIEEPKKESRLLVQPKQSYAAYDIAETNDDSKDFESLIKMPTSADGQLVLKSEKNWSADVLGCFDYFTLDLNLVSAAMKCIPFNECVQIEDKYFTVDQLTSFHNAVKEGKKAYKNILSNLEISDSSDITNLNRSLESKNEEQVDMSLGFKKTMSDNKITIAEEQNKNDDTEEDLDFLLSLESPTLQSNIKQMPLPKIQFKNGFKTQSATLSTKSNDFDTLLDSILGD